MSLYDHFPKQILDDMLSYGEERLKELQGKCQHSYAQFQFGLILDSPIDSSTGLRRYSLAACVKCYKSAYYDSVTREYVEDW